MPENLEKNSEFEEIRPYYDEEVNEVVQRLLKEPEFIKFLLYLFPDWKRGTINELLADVDSIKGFLKTLMYPSANAIIDKTIPALMHSGFDELDHQKAYLFISNHRDIILDSALLNVVLYEQGMDTSEVAIGSNLLVKPWIEDLVRINKNFIVHRDVPPKRLYEYSLRLSKYIRQDIVAKNASVWLAQKEGRTKDGNDVTQAGLLKMLSISGNSDLINNLKPLRIVPMAISYEFEPCDFLKAREIYIRQQTGQYKKTPDDDLTSMFVGLTSFKGRTKISIGEPLTEVIDELAGYTNKNEQIKRLASIIDQEIHAHYQLWPGNYIAHDLLSGDHRYKDRYTEPEKIYFLQHIDGAIKKLKEPSEEIKPILLKIYATPVENQEKTKV